MSENSNSVLPRIEMLVIAVFLISFLIWAGNKCNRTRNRYAPQEEVVSPAETLIDSSQLKTAEKPVEDKPLEPPPTPPSAEKDPHPTWLYVSIEGVNVRKDPSLTSDVIDKLALYDRVLFLNERTDFTEKVNLGSMEVEEPWVKIKTRKGRVGWVYGAGVSYYRYKHPGAL